jgi:hypothetical protein
MALSGVVSVVMTYVLAVLTVVQLVSFRDTAKKTGTEQLTKAPWEERGTWKFQEKCYQKTLGRMLLLTL